MIDATLLMEGAEPESKMGMMSIVQDFIVVGEDNTVIAPNEVQPVASVDGPEPISLDEAKAHLRVVGNDDDAYIASLISAACEAAEGRLNRTIRQRTRTAHFSGWDGHFVLLKPPFISVDAISYTDESGQAQTLDGTYYATFPDNDTGVVELAPGSILPSLYHHRRPITVTYLAGYPEGQVPRAIVQWMLLAIGTMYQNRESLATGVSVAPLPEDFMNLLIQQYRVYE